MTELRPLRDNVRSPARRLANRTLGPRHAADILPHGRGSVWGRGPVWKMLGPKTLWRGRDLNSRWSGYEPDALTGLGDPALTGETVPHPCTGNRGFRFSGYRAVSAASIPSTWRTSLRVRARTSSMRGWPATASWTPSPSTRECGM